MAAPGVRPGEPCNGMYSTKLAMPCRSTSLLTMTLEVGDTCTTSEVEIVYEQEVILCDEAFSPFARIEAG